MDGYREDERAPWSWSERKRDALALILQFGLFCLISVFTTREKATASVGTLLLLYVIITVMWSYTNEKWFRVAIGVIALVHFAAIWLIPFSFPPGPAISYILPVVTVDGFTEFGILRLLANNFDRHKP